MILQVRRHIRARFHDVIEAGLKAGAFHLPPAPGADPAALAAVSICDMGMRVSEWYDGQHKPTSSELATLHATYALRLVGASSER